MHSLTRCSSSKWKRIGRGSMCSSHRDNNSNKRYMRSNSRWSTGMLISVLQNLLVRVALIIASTMNSSRINLIEAMWGQSRIGGERGAHRIRKSKGDNRTRGRKRARPGPISAAAPRIWGRSWTRSLCCTCWKWSSGTRCHNLAWTSMRGWELSSGARLCAKWAQVWCGRGIETYIPCCSSTR